MTIHFKNGMTKKISKSVAEIINKRIIEGCGKFQTFSNENNNLFLVINLGDIVYID